MEFNVSAGPGQGTQSEGRFSKVFLSGPVEKSLCGNSQDPVEVLTGFTPSVRAGLVPARSAGHHKGRPYEGFFELGRRYSKLLPVSLRK